jgi:NAD(P)H-binding
VTDSVSVPGSASRRRSVALRGSAMRAAGNSRPVVISAAPVASDDHGTTLLYRLLVAPMLRALLGRGHADMATMEEATRSSGVDWTILRPPRLTNGLRTGTYRQARDANLRRGYPHLPG